VPEDRNKVAPEDWGPVNGIEEDKKTNSAIVSKTKNENAIDCTCRVPVN